MPAVTVVEKLLDNDHRTGVHGDKRIGIDSVLNNGGGIEAMTWAAR